MTRNPEEFAISARGSSERSYIKPEREDTIETLLEKMHSATGGPGRMDMRFDFSSASTPLKQEFGAAIEWWLAKLEFWKARRSIMRGSQSEAELCDDDRLLALYLQATAGDVASTTPPWATPWGIARGRTRWEARNTLKGTTTTSAMKQFVEEIARQKQVCAAATVLPSLGVPNSDDKPDGKASGAECGVADEAS